MLHPPQSPMHSVADTERPAASAAAAVNAVHELPSPNTLSSRTAFDTLHSASATEIDSVIDVTVSNTTAEEPVLVVSELRSSAVVTRGDNDQSAIWVAKHSGKQGEAISGSDADAEESELLTATAGSTRETRSVSSIVSTSDFGKTRFIKCESERQGLNFINSFGDAAATQEENVSIHAQTRATDDKIQQRNSIEHIGQNEEKEASVYDDQNGTLTVGEVTVAEVQKNKDAADASSRSIPPHTRPVLKVPNAQQRNNSEARPSWPAPAPRVPRAHLTLFGHQPFRPPNDHDESQRMRSQLMKARSDLDVERKLNTEMRRVVGAEKQASISAALADMLSDLLQKQADTLTARAKIQEKERDLQYREQKITQTETYLSEGQKQLKRHFEQQGIRTMSDVDEADLRHKIELKMEHHLSNVEGKIKVQIERLHQQEAAQKVREQQYKVLIRGALEDEIRVQLAGDRQTAIANNMVAEPEYGHGVDASKDSRVAKSSEAEPKQDFLKGYAACYRTLTILHDARHGKIAVDSPEIAFLFDHTHSENPYNIGLNIGRIEALFGKAEDPTSHVKIEEEAAVGNNVQSRSFRSDEIGHRSCDQATFSDVGSFRSSKLVDQVLSTQQERNNQPGRSYVPPRSTFAGELRGSSSSARTFNGTSAIRLGPQGNYDTKGAPAASSTWRAPGASAEYLVNGAAHPGRKTVRCKEDPDDEPATTNLIDLC